MLGADEARALIRLDLNPHPDMTEPNR
jgi:hypothetical protein